MASSLCGEIGRKSLRFTTKKSLYSLSSPRSAADLAIWLGSAAFILLGQFGYLPNVLLSLNSWLLRLPDRILYGITGALPFNFDLVDEGILLGRLPRSVEDIRHLRDEQNVRAIVDLTESWETRVSDGVIAELGIEVFKLPTPGEFFVFLCAQ